MKPLVFLLLLPLLLVTFPATMATSSTRSCKSSLYPKLCHALFNLNLPVDPLISGSFSLKHALKQSHALISLLDNYVSRNLLHMFRLPPLDDCRQLLELNTARLEQVEAALGGTGRLSRMDASRATALMSAVVTNQQTCLDGLEASRGTSRWGSYVRSLVASDVWSGLNDAAEAYGMSMELVAAAVGRRRESASVPKAAAVVMGHRGGNRKLLEVLQDDIPMNGSVVVAKDGSGDFETVGDAVASAPDGANEEDGYFVVTVKEGVYEENVVVPRGKKNLILVGEGMDKTFITGNRSVVDGWTTYNSATFAVHGDRFIAVDITFMNTAGPEKHQAVAVRNSADLSTFYRCGFVGYQDTLYAHSLRQFYRECDIYGTVDFIFGNAACVLQSCNIYARQPLPEQRNVITAQGRSHPNQTTGISIHNCTITATSDLDANVTHTYLGRPWKEYSRTVYMQSYIDAMIEPVGWLEWNGTFALNTLFYGEFENTGPGSDTGGRVQWPGYTLMEMEQAVNFTVYNLTAGDMWLPSTSVPYNSGLI